MKKMSLSKRALSVVLSVTLAATLCPATALADEVAAQADEPAGTTPPALMLDVRYSSGQPYIAVGQGTTTLDAFEFYGEPTGPLYIVATNIPFDTQAVQTLLRNPATSGTPAPIPTGLSIALMPVQ